MQISLATTKRAGVTFPHVLAFPPGAPLRRGGVSVSDGSCGGLDGARETLGPGRSLRCAALSPPHISRLRCYSLY